MMGGQNGFDFSKTPFDSLSGISTIWDSHPVVRVSWSQLKIAAGFRGSLGELRRSLAGFVL